MQPATRRLLASLLLSTLSAQAETLTPFSQLKTLPGGGWEPLEFPNINRKSQYRLVQEQDVQVVEAQTQASASGLIYRARLDIRQTPLLSWRWKISNTFQKGDASRKEGDDYPARIYVAFAFEPERASWFERSKRSAAELAYGAELPGTSLNYIWDNRQPVGTILTNPYSDATRMIVVNSGNQMTGQWVSQQRNLLDDYRQAFGREPPAMLGIAIMSDSDNTGEATTAWYGDVQLLAH